LSERPSRLRLGLLVLLSILGLFLVELVYDRIVPRQLQTGELLMRSFVPITYPPGYWVARLFLTVAILGPMGYLCGARRGRLLLYLFAGFLFVLHGPLLALLIQIYGRS
jgi:hypothetical protein